MDVRATLAGGEGIEGVVVEAELAQLDCGEPLTSMPLTAVTITNRHVTVCERGGATESVRARVCMRGYECIHVCVCARGYMYI